ncbi:MAG: hypothetical protein R3B48_30800 [Kofleriaceae bacterium]
MVRKVLISCSLLLAVACTDSAEPGSPCKANLTCGGDLVCNFQAAEPICLAPDADEDGDGITNDKDFCPATAGGVNHDEDGDGQGDSCDTCPIEKWSVNSTDKDGDGVSGICDPDDNDKGDKILFFESFASAATLNDWQLDDPAHFSIADDSLKATVTAADVDAVAKYILPISSDSVVAYTGFRVRDTAPAGVDGVSRDVSLEVLDPSPAAGGSRAKCGGTLTSSGGNLRLTTDMGETNEPMTGLFDSNVPYRILLQSAGATARCAQTGGQASKSAQFPVGNVGKAVVSLSLRSLHADYDYVLVVQSPLLR